MTTRLMLGKRSEGKEYPSLLVNVKEDYTPEHFDFWVVNGAWDGTFHNGYITVKHPWNPFSSLDKMEILTDNQDRLRSKDWYGEYNEVFANFNNPNYVAPKLEPVKYPDSWDDDVPF